MNGTPLQIKWAKRIRYRLYPLLTDIKDTYIHSDPWTQEQVRFFARCAMREQESTFWIACNNRSMKEMLQDQERRHVLPHVMRQTRDCLNSEDED